MIIFIPYLRYVSVAFALKIFSYNSITRKIYRKIANKFGQNRHSIVTDTEINRGLWLYNIIINSGLSLNGHTKILELGTGWIHFYGIFLRHLIDSKFILFDIQDNRQWQALKIKFNELQEQLSTMKLYSLDNNKARKIISAVAGKVSKARNFEDLYLSLGIDYIIEKEGSLGKFNDNEFDIIFSVDVFEHINSDSLKDTIDNIHRILKPGGLSIHQIGLDDHLTHYSPKMSSKQYLSYSDNIWELLFENRLQYFNRKQTPEYICLFPNQIFELIKYETDNDAHIENLKIHPQYNHFNADVLQSERAYIVHKKK